MQECSAGGGVKACRRFLACTLFLSAGLGPCRDHCNFLHEEQNIIFLKSQLGIQEAVVRKKMTVEHSIFPQIKQLVLDGELEKHVGPLCV